MLVLEWKTNYIVQISLISFQSCNKILFQSSLSLTPLWAIGLNFIVLKQEIIMSSCATSLLVSVTIQCYPL